MCPATSTKVFISYSKEDSTFANRIREDLINSRILAWCYEPDGEPNIQFPQEIEARIREADFFCLIDSPRARSSRWVQRECEIASSVAAVSERPCFVVCCMEEGQDWKEPELFPGHNERRYFDFTDGRSAIRELCLSLGVNYQAPYSLPRDVDFRDELERTPIGVAERQRLIDHYRRFQVKRQTAPDVAEAYLKIIQTESEDLAIGLTSPTLALAVLQADAERLQDAAETFALASRQVPGDPRGWAGLGGALYYLDRYEEALAAYRRAKSAFRKLRTADETDHYGLIVHNLAQTLRALGLDDEAEREVLSVDPGAANRLDVILLRAELAMSRGDYRRSINMLEHAISHIKDGIQKLGSLAALRLAECYGAVGDFWREDAVLQTALWQYPEDPEVPRRIAAHHAAEERREEAVELMRIARGRSPNIKYQAEYALLLKNLRYIKAAVREATAALSMTISTRADRYYLGLAYFLVGKREIAEAEFQKSKEDRKLASWPWYDALLK